MGEREPIKIKTPSVSVSKRLLISIPLGVILGVILFFILMLEATIIGTFFELALSRMPSLDALVNVMILISCLSVPIITTVSFIVIDKVDDRRRRVYTIAVAPTLIIVSGCIALSVSGIATSTSVGDQDASISEAIISSTPTNTLIPPGSNTPTVTSTQLPTHTPTITLTPSITPTPSPTSTPSITPTPSSTPTPLPTSTFTPTPTLTNTPLPTPTPDLAIGIRDEIESVLGESNRGVERAQEVSYGHLGDPTIIYIRWTNDENLLESWVRLGAKIDVRDILEVIDGMNVEYSEVWVEGSFPLVDIYGNTAEVIVVKMFYDKSTIDLIGWYTFDYNNVYLIADDGWVHPAFRD